MSSYKRVVETGLSRLETTVLSRRSALGIGLAGLAGLTVSACGFRPMYGNVSATSPGSATSTKLALIKIEPIADRVGQQLHNLLRDRMNPAGQPDKPAYRLAVQLAPFDQVISNGNTHVRHHNLTMVATYWLSPSDTDKGFLMDKTDSRVSVSYDTLDDPFNDISTFEDAQGRAVDQLADIITTRVGAYFSKSSAG